MTAFDGMQTGTKKVWDIGEFQVEFSPSTSTGELNLTLPGLSETTTKCSLSLTVY